MKYYQIFTVMGKAGTFPTDMLRYDCCFPANQDASLFGKSFNPDANGLICVALKRYVSRKDQMPTSERWASFGWKVLPSVRTEKI